ncbi:MAG: DUF1501 domain-containing protein [Verrucomicrobiota bacterium]
MKHPSQKISRRSFLGQASCAGVSATPLLSTLLNLRMTNTVVAASSGSNDYKALVCFFFGGGNDSFNMLAPKGATEYAEYAATRTDQALPQASILQLNGTHNGKTFGLHPGMPELQTIYNANPSRLAFVCNVGTLVEPIANVTEYNSNQFKVPPGLFSHADQIHQWQTSIPNQNTSLGWGGRVSDLLAPCNVGANISMNISLSGSNIFQTGASNVSYEISTLANGSVTFRGSSDETLTALGTTAINSMMDAQYSNLFKQAFAQRHRSSLDAAVEFSDAIGAQTVNTAFSDNDISQSFRMVARTIAARNLLNMKRQTFFIMFGGFDHHDELLNNHAEMLPVISKAMSEFDTAMTELGVSDKVTTFTASDFGRTLSSNGKGTDHAWGSNQMVMGGAVNGGQFYGTYPSLDLGNNLDTGRGRLIPTLSTDEYFAELARWFGVSNTDLPTIFPNLTRFYTPSSTAPVGFMG